MTEDDRSAGVPIVAVTVLEDRASITRRGSVAVTAGQSRVVIDGVAPVLVDKSLAARVTAGGARVLDVRCERYVAPWRQPNSGADAEPAKLRAERTALDGKRAEADARARSSSSHASALANLAAAAWQDLAVAATRGAAPDPSTTAHLAGLDAAARDAGQRAAAAVLETEQLAAALARLDRRVARAEHQAGSAAARLVVDVAGDAAGTATLELGYVVPCAAWRPYHRATLVGGDAVDWLTTACVWQATGEDWPDCALTFSLERASLGVDPPELADDILRTRRRAEVVAVEARDYDVQTTGLGAAGGSVVVPGIDDGGLGLVLRGDHAVTVRADGMPHRVSVARFSAPAQLSLVVMPLVSPWVHVRARLANTGAAPLLAGPVDLVMASGFVGRGEVGFVAPGEKLEIGFGPEADVRAHRDERREREDAGILGGWNTQTVRVAVRLSNLGATRREVIVTERVPVSEVEQVEVAVAPADAYAIREAGVTQVGARQIDDRGLVTWTVDLPAHARRVVTLEYKLKSRKDVAGV
nr:mucoidy inhibitor MuiA family protein [Kofleriaceae bacterium]